MNIGDSFGKLKIIDRSKIFPNRRFVVRCSCGSHPFELSKQLLIENFLIGCGCSFNNELSNNISNLYGTWEQMVRRCTDEKFRFFDRYGGRGIVVYRKWIGSKGFFEFKDYILNSIGNKINNNYSLDRINNDGNYEPGNLRWASAKKQSRNRSSNIIDKSKVFEIKQKWNSGNYTQKELTKEYGYSNPCSISRIVNNNRWN